MHWDTVVIGSGPGGLTAALALARAGQRVLVLEQHYLPGGWTHSFTLGGHRFSPGVHYIGNLQPGGGVRRLYEGLGLGRDLEFCELNPDGFDHFLIDGERFDQPKGLEPWKNRLIERFPAEANGIRRYFDILTGICEDVCKCEKSLSFPAILAVPFRAPKLIRWGFRTLDALLDATIRDSLLKAVLSAQCGNHGLAPSRVSLPLHASMTSHYFEGAYYPRGGAKRIPAAYLRALKRHGSKIRLRTPVTRILVENGRAVGVEVEGGERIRADHVVCNADPAVVYGRLLDERHCGVETRKLKRTHYSVGMLSLFCAVKMDLRAMGYDSGNYWLYRTKDVAGVYEDIETRVPDRVDGMFLTITSLKDPTHGHDGTHTVEMFTFVPYDAFGSWREGESGERGAAYEAKKQELAARMLEAAEDIIPGIRRNLALIAIGSPLTNDHYCRSYRGAIYGTAKTPWQVGPFSFDMRGPIEGLTLAGSSIISHGVAGASMSGLMAAQRILGAAEMDDLLGPADGSLRIVPSEHPETWLPGETDSPAFAEAS